MRGNIFENLVVLDIIKSRLNQGRDHNLFFYRDSKQNEVDLIHKAGNELIPIEIKSAATIHSQFFKNLDFFSNLVKNRVSKRFLIYAGKQEQRLNNTEIINYRHACKTVDL